jgi:ABC-2 type transport system ATP-binding protein
MRGGADLEILKVEGLTKDYNGFLALKGVDFTIEKGEVFGFLGPNGAGKTTTINILTGLTRPTSGRIDILGKDGIKDIKKVQESIGIVPDESNLYDEMSGTENLEFCASLYGIHKDIRTKRAQELLLQFGLQDTGKKKFKSYSKGMKRKLVIAAGIIHRPGILFLDEPTTGIDVESARQIRKLIFDLNKTGTTIFLTTHYIEEAQRLCRRIGFIVEGKVIKIDETAKLLEEAQKEHTIEFDTDDTSEVLIDSLENDFNDFKISRSSAGKIHITSQEKIDLMPFMRYLDEKKVMIREARVLYPSLEDVFVKITGIEADKLMKEKEGKKK